MRSAWLRIRSDRLWKPGKGCNGCNGGKGCNGVVGVGVAGAVNGHASGSDGGWTVWRNARKPKCWPDCAAATIKAGGPAVCRQAVAGLRKPCGDGVNRANLPKAESCGLNRAQVVVFIASTAIKSIAISFLLLRHLCCGAMLIAWSLLFSESFWHKTPRRRRTIFDICVGFHENSIKCATHQAICFGQLPTRKA